LTVKEILMRRFASGVAAVALGLVIAGSAQAKGGSGNNQGNNHGGHGSNSSFRSNFRSNSFNGNHNFYHNTFGHKFSHGYFYSGHNHYHWTHFCWYPRYGCYCYWCPSTCCYYYWCASEDCYYPINYITVAPPTISQVVNVGNSTSSVGGPSAAELTPPPP